MAGASYSADIACKGNPDEMVKMWVGLKDMSPFAASGSLIDTGARINSIRGEKTAKNNPENLYHGLAKAFPGLRFFIVQFFFSEKSRCACFEAKNGRMRQTGVWEDESPEAGEIRRAWLGALQRHWLLESSAPELSAAGNSAPDIAEGHESASRLASAEKQTVRMCLEAVQTDGEALAYVHRQTPKICLAAVENRGTALRFAKKQPVKICRAAVKQNGLALEYVQEQTREICRAAVKQNYLAYRYVKETSPSIYRQFMTGFQEALARNPEG
jgi:hypothetical protein